MAEVKALMELVKPYQTVLEIGHYYGLSTCALVKALEARGGYWHMLTVDPHQPTVHVPNPATPAAFMTNLERHFDSPRLRASFCSSQRFGPDEMNAYDFVFYDGDHGAEQYRFTEAVIKSSVQALVFDDADFFVPVECAKELHKAGWVNRSPKLDRRGGDKAHPDTMTLGVYYRAN